MSMDNVPPGFNEIKPSPFPLNMDIRPVKLTDAEDPTENFHVTFLSSQSLVQNFIENLQTQKNKTEASGSSTDPDKILSRSQGTRGIEGIYEGVAGFFSPSTLAQIEQVGDAGNFEDPKSATYTDMRSVLGQNPMYQADPALQQKIFQSKLLEKAKKSPGQGYTMPHNMSLLYGIGSDPFKKWDKDNKEKFGNAESYTDLHDQSLSPRNILQQMDPTFWSSVKGLVDRVKTVHTASFKNRGDAANSLSWTDVPEIFTDAQQKDESGQVTNAFDVRPNYYSIVTSQMWRTMTKQDTFNFVTMAAEAKTRAHNVLRQIMGPAKLMRDASTLVAKTLGTDDADSIITSSATTDTSGASAAPASGSTDATPPTDATTDTTLNAAVPLTDTAQDTAGKMSRALSKVDSWWDNVGKKLDEAQMFPYGLLADIAPAMETMMNWGNWDTDIAAVSPSGGAAGADAAADDPAMAFRSKMVSDYLEQFGSTYLPKFEGDQKVTLGALSKVTDTQGNAVFSALKSHGLINSAGELQPSFDPNSTSLDLGLEPTLQTKVLSYLKDTYRGNFSLDQQDNTSSMRDIKLKSLDGQYRSIDEVMDLLRSGNSPLDKINNVQVAYNYFMDLYSTLSGMSVTASEGTNGMVNASEAAKDASVNVQVSKDAQWTSSDGKRLMSNTGELTVNFKNQNAAQGFQDTVQMMLSLLEPLVSVFGPKTVNGISTPYRTLIDNSLSIDGKGETIRRGSDGYKMDVDVDFDDAMFKQETWTKVSGRLTDKVNTQIIATLFSRTEFNFIQQRQHNLKVETYQKNKDKAKQEFEQEEADAAKRKMERAEEEAAAAARRKREADELAAQENQKAAAQSHAEKEGEQS